ncbi:hypothetical protein [Eggerthella sinensis]|uniref:hypothetical protein n=1 Tax=Eggerthella sinensis TaxID=242230 RepID=UPI001D095FD3|nr:hypothetical protein [Eggerthella sinensis]MCB7036678.1 hypothetical protein [Eggerthella sinensis]
MPEARKKETALTAEKPPRTEGEIACRDLLTSLLKVPLGHVTFSADDLLLKDEGRRSGRQLFHNGKYFHKRLADYPDRPVNGKCQERVLAIYKEILSGRMPRYEPVTVTTRLVGVLENASGLDMGRLAAQCSRNDPKARPTLIELLDSLLSMSLDAESVAAPALRSRFEGVLGWNETRSHASDEHGINAFYYSVTETDYPRRINEVSSRLDVAHFHGLTWTNFHREYIRSALGKPEVRVRVTLLDPSSRFFQPYADFIRIDVNLLRAKYQEVVDIWKTLYTDAVSGEREGASLKLYANRGFPAKSIYRFDDEIIVTPANNAQPKAQFMAYACRKLPDNENGAFGVYEKELEWLFSEGAELVWSSED